MRGNRKRPDGRDFMMLCIIVLGQAASHLTPWAAAAVAVAALTIAALRS